MRVPAETITQPLQRAFAATFDDIGNATWAAERRDDADEIAALNRKADLLTGTTAKSF